MSKYTDADVDKFMRDNEGLMDDLVKQEERDKMREQDERAARDWVLERPMTCAITCAPCEKRAYLAGAAHVRAERGDNLAVAVEALEKIGHPDLPHHRVAKTVDLAREALKKLRKGK